MRQFILIMICILLQVIHVHAGSKDITWKWDYSEADDILLICLARRLLDLWKRIRLTVMGGN